MGRCDGDLRWGGGMGLGTRNKDWDEGGVDTGHP